MSEETAAPVSDEVREQSAEPSSGTRLREARESLGLEVDDVARQLCLSPRQVAALEADDIDQLPSPTFARGFIRNYAKLLHLDAESLLGGYRGMVTTSAGAASISLHSEGIPINTGNRKAWMAYLISSVLVILSGLGWWLYMDWRENRPAAPVEAVKPIASELPPSPAKPAAETQPEPAPMGAGMSAAELTQPPQPSPPAQLAPAIPAAGTTGAAAAPASAANPIPASAAVAASATASGHIVMTFSAPSWVRVIDRDSKEIFHKNQPGSGQETVDGNPPFKLVIGNAAGVQISYNGKQVDLAPNTKANVAHLTLE